MGLECYLLHISGVHANLVVARAEVQLGKEPRAVQLIKEFVHHCNCISGLHCDGVQRPVINTEAPCHIRFLHK